MLIFNACFDISNKTFILQKKYTIMEYGEKCNIFLKLINKTDYFWNFFYVSSIVIFATLIQENIALYNLVFKILASIIYISFNIFNATALIRCYIFLKAMCTEIKTGSQENFTSPKLIAILNSLSYKRRINIVWISYSIVTIINLMLLWLGNCFTYKF